MAKRDEVFPSKYLKASDLNGKPIVVVIESAALETLKTLEGKEQTKTVLYFKGAKKSLAAQCDELGRRRRRYRRRRHRPGGRGTQSRSTRRQRQCRASPSTASASVHRPSANCQR